LRLVSSRTAVTKIGAIAKIENFYSPHMVAKYENMVMGR